MATGNTRLKGSENDPIFLRARHLAGLQLQKQFSKYNTKKMVNSSFDGFKC
jgi:hypothetical protein